MAKEAKRGAGAAAAATMPPDDALVLVRVGELRRVLVEDLRRVLAESRPASSAANDTDWISKEEAAKIIGVELSYLRRLKGLPRHGTGRRPRYLRSEVDAFVRSRAGG